MRKTLIIAIACVLVVGLTATNADATSLTVDSSEYVGYYYPPTGSDSFGDLLILSKLGQGETDTVEEGRKTYEYSRVGSDIEATLPTPTATINTDLSNVAPHTYIVGKYDGNNGYALVWLVGEGALDSVTLETNWAPPGLSIYPLGSVTMYESMPAVPDGGMTLMFLGCALVGLETLRRRFRA